VVIFCQDCCHLWRHQRRLSYFDLYVNSCEEIQGFCCLVRFIFTLLALNSHRILQVLFTSVEELKANDMQSLLLQIFLFLCVIHHHHSDFALGQFGILKDIFHFPEILISLLVIFEGLYLLLILHCEGAKHISKLHKAKGQLPGYQHRHKGWIRVQR